LEKIVEPELNLTIYTPLKNPTKEDAISALAEVTRAAKYINNCKSLKFDNIDLCLFLDGYDDPAIPKFCEEDHSAKILRSQINKGLTFAANQVIKHSNSSHILRLDFGDLITPVQSKAVDSRAIQNADIIGIPIRTITPNGDSTKTSSDAYQAFRNQLANTIPVDQLKSPEGAGCIIKTDVFRKIGCYPELPHGDDLWLWLNTHSNNLVVSYIDDLEYQYFKSPDSLSAGSDLRANSRLSIYNLWKDNVAK